MNYSQAVDYINSFLVFGSKPGLERIGNLLRLLGNPEKHLKFIHVAGTNGKGSTCAYLSSILKADGKRVGMFTSPYVIDFAERFQINGENISHEDLAKITAKIKSVVDNIDDDLMPTEFELITAIGYEYFYEKNCDVVVLEVGLGGLYDSTNTIDTPLCSVICSISLDHTAILGDTIRQIAEQKAGIIKPHGNTVIYPLQEKDALDVIKTTANDNNNHLVIPNIERLKIINEDLDGTTAEYDDITFTTHILGKVQPINAITAIEAVKTAYPNISDSMISKGIENAEIFARCKVYDSSRPIIIDGAHNPDGVNSLIDLLNKFVNKKRVAVLGMMKDKDIDAVLEKLAVCFDKIITVTVDNPRSISAYELCEKAKKYCPDTKAVGSVSEAMDIAKGLSDYAICICGSFYLISQIYKYLD